MHSKQLSDGLADLARANERKRDAALLRATTELFVLDVIHERDEIRRYEELTTHFLPKASVDDRIFVAERLAIVSDAPQSIIRTLARDVIDVAKPVLRHSSVLGPIDLLSVIAATGVEHHRLIARRTSLSAEVTRALRLTGDADVIAQLDRGLPPKPTPVEHAIDTSAATRVAPPPPLTHVDRFDPWRFLSLDRQGRVRLIAEIASRPPARGYAGSAKRLDRAFRSILSAAQIVGHARGGQLGPIIGAISDGLDLPPSLVAASINDKSGEVLAIMLKALRLDDNQARQVFLLASPIGREVKTFFPISDLYAGMEPGVAETMIEAWRDAATLKRVGHEQHLAENGDRRRGAATETARKSDENRQDTAKRA